MTKITWGYAWEKQEAKRVEGLERLRRAYASWQEELFYRDDMFIFLKKGVTGDDKVTRWESERPIPINRWVHLGSERRGL